MNSKVISNVVFLLIGFGIGLCLLPYVLKITSEQIDTILVTATIVIPTVLVLTIVLYFYKERLINKVIGIKDCELDELNIGKIAKAIFSRDYNSMSNSTRAIASIYGRMRANYFIVLVIQTIVLSFIGLIASIVVFNQNELIKAQNSFFKTEADQKKIDDLELVIFESEAPGRRQRALKEYLSLKELSLNKYSKINLTQINLSNLNLD